MLDVVMEKTGSKNKFESPYFKKALECLKTNQPNLLDELILEMRQELQRIEKIYISKI